MCNTLNDQNAQSCKYCGYIFEDYSNTRTDNSPSPQWEQPSIDNFPPPTADTFTEPSSPTVSTSAPLFVVSKSLLGSILPGIIYLVFILLFTTASGFSVYSLGVVALFILIAFIPNLFTPRKYEFYDNSLRINKIIGKDSEISYSESEIHDQPMKRRPRIILTVVGQRRTIVIPGNPSNAQLGEDLNQFLQKKLKKHDQKPSNQQQSTSSTDARTDDDVTGSDSVRT
jgi:hypothetical protein